MYELPIIAKSSDDITTIIVLLWLQIEFDKIF